MAQTEGLLRRCSEEEALRIADWLGLRYRRARRTVWVIEGSVMVAVFLAGGLVLRRVSERSVFEQLLHGAAIASAGVVVGIWYKKSPSAAGLRALLQDLALVPWPSARVKVINYGSPSSFACLPASDTALTALWEEDLAASPSPAMTEAALVAWLHYIKGQYDKIGFGRGIPLAEAMLREAAGHGESKRVRKLVAGLAKKKGGELLQGVVTRAARDTLAAFDRPAKAAHEEA